MENLKAGFARIDITPPIGHNMSGYYHERLSEGILDPLLATAVAVNDGKTTAVIISADVLGLRQEFCDLVRDEIAKRYGLSREAVFISCTHTHLAYPVTDLSDERYHELMLSLTDKLSGLAKMAIDDMKPSEMYTNSAETPVDISFIRRRKTKDGKLVANTGKFDTSVETFPDGDADRRVALINFVRENAPEIAIINFQVHPDVVGGLELSADYPGFVRRTYEAAVENSLCMYINGAQGDTNHINVETPDGELKAGYEFSRHMGRTIAVTAMSLRAMAKKTKATPIRAYQKNTNVPHNKATEEELREARVIVDLHESGRDDEIPQKGDLIPILNLVVSTRMVKLENAPDFKELYVSGLSIGDFAILGLPGEPFTDIGRRIKESSKFKMTFISCCANGYEGYFPNDSTYADGGYEVLSARYKEGTAKKLTETGKEVLDNLFFAQE